MPRTNLVFFHGMGVQDPGYHQAVWDFLVEKHQAIAGSDLRATCTPKAFFYHDIFTELRQAGSLDILRPLIQDAGALKAIEDLQASNAFLYTHVLDVLAWRFHAPTRNRIITKLAAELMPFIQTLPKSPDNNLVVVGHSLGTAVATEVIHYLGTHGVSEFQLIPAVHMLADVAKVLEQPEVPAYRPPTPSLCRPWTQDPEDRAMLLNYFNHRNELDPIPLVDRFRPPEWPKTYHETVFRSWGEQVQPHDLLTYVRAPAVYVKLLRSITQDGATYSAAREQLELQATPPSSPLGAERQAKFEQLATQYEDASTLGDFIQLGRAFSDSNLW